MDHDRLILEVLEGNKVFCDVNASVLHSSNMDVMLTEIDVGNAESKLKASIAKA